MKELLEKIKKNGIRIELSENNLFAIINDNDNEEQIKEELEEIIKDFYSENKSSYIDYHKKCVDFLIRNDKYISKDKMLLLIANNYAKTSDFNKIIFKSAEKLDKIKKMMDLRKSIVIYLDSAENERITKNTIKIIDYDSVFNKEKKQDNKNLKIIQELEKKYNFDNLIKDFNFEDLIICFDNKRINSSIDKKCFMDILRIRVFFNTIMEEENINFKELVELLDDKDLFLAKGEKNVGTNTYFEEIKTALTEYIEYIDIDKLMLVLAFEKRKKLENAQYTEEEAKQLKQSLQDIKHYFDEKGKKYKSYCIRNKEDVIINGIHFNSFSYKELEHTINKFQEGKYIRETDLIQFRNRVLSGEISLLQLEGKISELLKFSDEEKTELSNMENDNYLFFARRMNDKELVQSINKKVKFSLQEVKFLIDKKAIDNKTVLDLYMKDKISIDDIAELSKENEFDKVIEEKDLLDYYDIFIKENNNKSKTNFEKYELLYKSIKLKNKNQEEIESYTDVLMGEILDRYNGEEQKKVLVKFYQDKIISLNTVTSWEGPYIANDWFKKGILNSQDMKELFKEKEITVESIKELLSSSEETVAQKLDFIYKIFDEESEEEDRIVDDLENFIKRGRKTINIHKQYKGRGRRRIISDEEIEVKRKRNPIKVRRRWRLMSLLDKGYTNELFDDNHAIFYLPNVKNGEVVIEKLFQNNVHKSKNGEKESIPSYGKATYILSMENFIKYNNEYNIIKQQDGKKYIDRTVLMELNKLGAAKKIVHSKSWGNSLKEYCGIEKDNTEYSKEHIEEIDKTIELIERDRNIQNNEL